MLRKASSLNSAFRREAHGSRMNPEANVSSLPCQFGTRVERWSAAARIMIDTSRCADAEKTLI